MDNNIPEVFVKAAKRKEARQLRKKGFSVREIAVKIECSKSSISQWVRGVDLTTQQIERLKSNQDKGRARAAQHPNSPKHKWARIRNQIIDKSAKDIPGSFSEFNLKVLGAALYWAEGYNASQNIFAFSNSNPDMIKIIMQFLRKICKVPKHKIKGRLNIHPHLDIAKAEKFWANVTGIPRSSFNKSVLAVSKSSKQKKDTLPLGTFNVIICDVLLVSRVKGWIKGLSQWAGSSVG
ncbi:hypothetical protein ACFL0T_07915 [Candidatus Omnitrophota bacterium]